MKGASLRKSRILLARERSSERRERWVLWRCWKEAAEGRLNVSGGLGRVLGVGGLEKQVRVGQGGVVGLGGGGGGGLELCLDFFVWGLWGSGFWCLGFCLGGEGGGVDREERRRRFGAALWLV